MILHTRETASGGVNPKFSKILPSAPVFVRGTWVAEHVNTAKVLPASGLDWAHASKTNIG